MHERESARAPSPLFTHLANDQYQSMCLNADKYDLRDGTPVRLWTQYAAANQFWS